MLTGWKRLTHKVHIDRVEVGQATGTAILPPHLCGCGTDVQISYTYTKQPDGSQTVNGATATAVLPRPWYAWWQCYWRSLVVCVPIVVLLIWFGYTVMYNTHACRTACEAQGYDHSNVGAKGCGGNLSSSCTCYSEGVTLEID